MSYNYTTISLTLFFTSLRTQCWPGYVQLLPPFTPRLVVNFDFSFSPMEVDLPNLESQNQAENISVVLPSAPIKVLDGSIKGFMNYDRTYKQTDKQRLQLYIQIYLCNNDQTHFKIFFAILSYDQLKSSEIFLTFCS